jgi:uncharacterized protein YrrD
MRLRLKELKNKPVISMRSGARLGAVLDFLVDETYLQFTALIIGGGAVVGGHKQAVGYAAIRGIGTEAVLVSGSNAVQEVGYRSPLASGHALEGILLRAMSESGANLGRVVDIEFEAKTGGMTRLWLARPDDGGVREVGRSDIARMTEQTATIRHAVIKDSSAQCLLAA